MHERLSFDFVNMYVCFVYEVKKFKQFKVLLYHAYQNIPIWSPSREKVPLIDEKSNQTRLYQVSTHIAAIPNQPGVVPTFPHTDLKTCLAIDKCLWVVL